MSRANLSGLHLFSRETFDTFLLVSWLRCGLANYHNFPKVLDAKVLANSADPDLRGAV